jgi:hypothetical protein
METKFNIHVAINLHAGEVIGVNYLGNPVIVNEDLKFAHRLAQNDNFLWGYDVPYWADVLTGKQMTKKEFKKRYSSLRKHYFVMNNEIKG